MSYNEDDDQQPSAPSRRWLWIAVVIALILLSAGAYSVQRWMTPMRDTEKMQALVKAMGERITAADRDFAARMETLQRESPLASYGPQQAIDPVARKNTREWAEAGIALIDETLAKREQISNETIAQVEASKAGPEAKGAMLKALREAAKRTSASVRIMNAMRVYLAKIVEMIVYLDQNALAIQLREGQLEFDDSAAGEVYNKFEHEIAALQRELEGLLQQQRR